MNYSLKNLKLLLGTLWSRNGSNSDENYLSNLWIISCITFIEITTRHVEWCSSSNPPPSPNQHCSSLLWNSTAHKYTMQSQLGPQQWSGCSVSSCNPNLFFFRKGNILIRKSQIKIPIRCHNRNSHQNQEIRIVCTSYTCVLLRRNQTKITKDIQMETKSRDAESINHPQE